MNRTTGLPPELVARHGAGLRALARALLGREDEVDDAVQDAWVRFLEAPPRQAEGVGAWLATVLRNGVVNRRRSQARRTAREVVSARPELIDAEALREREELLRVVVAAVLSLDEPYRSVVLLRWFDGLPPREIAARLQVDATVVHTRLSRAHQKLREKLERDLGRERSLARLGLLAGRNGVEAGAAASAAGVTLMSSKFVIGMGAAALAVGASAYWMLAQANAAEPATLDEAVELAQGRAAEATAQVQDEGAVVARQATPTARVDVGAAQVQDDPSPAWAPPTYEYELVVKVVDALDRPSAAPFLAAPAGGMLNRIGQPDADGTIAFKWLAFTPSMELDVAPSETSAVRRLRVTAGSQQLSLQCDATQMAPMLGEVPILAASPERSDGTRVSEIYAVAASPRLAGFPCSHDGQGRVVFVDPAMFDSVGEDATELVEFADVSEEEHVIAGLASEALELRVASHKLRSLASSRVRGEPAVVGQLRSESGAPLAGVSVSIRSRGDSTWRTRTTDERGDFQLPRVAAGACDVVLGGGDQPAIVNTVEVAAEGQLRLDAMLDPGQTIELRLVDASGSPLKHWRVQVEDAALAFVDSTISDDDGVARIPNAPYRALNVLASPQGFTAVAPLVAARAAWAGEKALELALEVDSAAAAGSLRFNLTPTPGPALDLVASRLWRSDSQRAVTAPHPSPVSDTDRTLQIRCDGLLPGVYRFEALLAGRGVLAIDALVVAPGSDVALELGPLPPSGIVRFEGDPAPQPIEIELVRRTDSVETAMAHFVSPGSRLRLPVGEYVVRSLQGERTKSHALIVIADSETTLGL